MRSFIGLAMTAGALAALITAAWAQQAPEPSLRAELNPSQGLTVGDVLTLTLTASYPKDWTVSFPSLGENVGEFLVREGHLTPPTTEGNLRRQQMTASLTIFRTGKFQIPELPVTFADPQGRRTEKLFQPLSAEVVTVVNDKTPELKDLKPQAQIPESYIWLWLGLLFAAVAAAVAYLIKRRLAGRRQAEDRTVPVIPLPPPHEQARRALEALQAKNLLASGLVKQFYFELSEIMRRMVGRQYGIVTLERTTGEILDELRDVAHEPLSIYKLEDFLTRCDLIKFAKYLPLPGEQDELLRAAHGFIEDVRKSYDQERQLAAELERGPAVATKPSP